MRMQCRSVSELKHRQQCKLQIGLIHTFNSSILLNIYVHPKYKQTYCISDSKKLVLILIFQLISNGNKILKRKAIDSNENCCRFMSNFICDSVRN